MFFIKHLSLNVTLHPSYFGPHMDRHLQQRLLADVEGSCTGQFGYIVAVLDVNNIDVGAGKVIPGEKGEALFEVHYKALVWKPFKGEVVDGQVASINKMGFFANVGPLMVFVSKHLIPSDMKYSPTAGYASHDQVLNTGSPVRIKIIGTRTDVNSISAIGSIKEDYLGPL